MSSEAAPCRVKYSVSPSAEIAGLLSAPVVFTSAIAVGAPTVYCKGHGPYAGDPADESEMMTDHDGRVVRLRY